MSDDDDQERRDVPLEGQMPAPSGVGCERCQQLTVESWLHRSGLTTGGTGCLHSWSVASPKSLLVGQPSRHRTTGHSTP